MLLPSLRSKVSVSLVTRTSCAKGISISTVEVVIPCLQQSDPLARDGSSEFREFRPNKQRPAARFLLSLNRGEFPGLVSVF